MQQIMKHIEDDEPFAMVNLRLLAIPDITFADKVIAGYYIGKYQAKEGNWDFNMPNIVKGTGAAWKTIARRIPLHIKWGWIKDVGTKTTKNGICRIFHFNATNFIKWLDANTPKSFMKDNCFIPQSHIEGGDRTKCPDPLRTKCPEARVGIGQNVRTPLGQNVQEEVRSTEERNIRRKKYKKQPSAAPTGQAKELSAETSIIIHSPSGPLDTSSGLKESADTANELESSSYSETAIGHPEVKDEHNSNTGDNKGVIESSDSSVSRPKTAKHPELPEDGKNGFPFDQWTKEKSSPDAFEAVFKELIV